MTLADRALLAVASMPMPHTDATILVALERWSTWRCAQCNDDEALDAMLGQLGGHFDPTYCDHLLEARCDFQNLAYAVASVLRDA